MRGRFITLEGIDGAGKSTHQATIVERLRATGKTVISTREPGGTELGEKLRALLLNEPMHLETEALLMFAARREHIALVIGPALERGDWVVSDRFTDASYAYQGGGRGLPAERLAILERWVQGDLQPDLTFLFDLDPAIARQRLDRSGNAPDRFELEREDFFGRVRSAYLARVASDTGRFAVIDGSRPVAEVRQTVEDRIARLLG